MWTICSGLLMSQLWNPMSCVSHTTVRRFLMYIVGWLVSHIVLPDKWSTYVFLHNLHTSLYSWVIYTHIVTYITIFLSYIYTYRHVHHYIPELYIHVSSCTSLYSWVIYIHISSCTSLYSWVIYTHIVMYITIFLSYIYTHIVMLWFEKLFMYMLTNSFITHILFDSSTMVTFIVITNVFIYQRKLCISIGWHV